MFQVGDRVIINHDKPDECRGTITHRTWENASYVRLDWPRKLRPSHRHYPVNSDGQEVIIRHENLTREVCSEHGEPFDDNPGKDICKTCEEWIVTEGGE